MLNYEEVVKAIQATEGSPEYCSMVARCMRELSEDVLMAIDNKLLPQGNGKCVRWRHPSGMVVEIFVPDTDPDSTNFGAVIYAGDTVLKGGFALFNEAYAEALELIIEGILQ
jgi:hypothetical protein